jgi:hypothetical protein
MNARDAVLHFPHERAVNTANIRAVSIAAR